MLGSALVLLTLLKCCVYVCVCGFVRENVKGRAVKFCIYFFVFSFYSVIFIVAVVVVFVILHVHTHLVVDSL